MSISDMGNCVYELDMHVLENKSEIDNLKANEQVTV